MTLYVLVVRAISEARCGLANDNAYTAFPRKA